VSRNWRTESDNYQGQVLRNEPDMINKKNKDGWKKCEGYRGNSEDNRAGGLGRDHTQEKVLKHHTLN